jgi:TolA-binding protein
MRNQGIFLVFILCLTLGLQFSYHVFEEHFSDRHDLEKTISALEEQRQRQDLQQALLQNQLEDLKANVFETLGKKSLLAWNEKQWLAALRGPASVSPLERPKSSALLAEAKAKFREKLYADSAEKLKSLINDYPTSKDIVEAHFLLAESLYLSGQTEPSLDLMDQMMTRYPESELTGFIMLRMGQIFESRNRPAEAKEIYETVLRQFPRSEVLKSQAEKMMRGADRS